MIQFEKSAQSSSYPPQILNFWVIEQQPEEETDETLIEPVDPTENEPETEPDPEPETDPVDEKDEVPSEPDAKKSTTIWSIPTIEKRLINLTEQTI